VIRRLISPGVQIITILIVLILLQLICPDVLRSVVDLIVLILKEVRLKVGATETLKGFL
jgi:hypothetical protein